MCHGMLKGCDLSCVLADHQINPEEPDILKRNIHAPQQPFLMTCMASLLKLILITEHPCAAASGKLNLLVSPRMLLWGRMTAL